MAGRRKKTSQSSSEITPVSSEPQSDTDVVVEQLIQQADTTPAKPKRSFESLPENPGFGGEHYHLPDGTTARIKDYGNAEGIAVQFDLPEGVEKPSQSAIDHLKERRYGHTSFQYKGKGQWHKHVRGPGLDPTLERDDADDRFRKAVQAQREASEGQGQGEGPTP